MDGDGAAGPDDAVLCHTADAVDACGGDGGGLNSCAAAAAVVDVVSTCGSGEVWSFIGHGLDLFRLRLLSVR